MTQLRAQLKPLPLPTRQAALPDGDEVSRGLCLQQAEVEADAVTNGDGDQPDAVLGAGVGTGEARGVHSAIEGGDVPAAGDCQGEDTNTEECCRSPPPREFRRFLKHESSCSRRLGGMGRGDRAKEDWVGGKEETGPRMARPGFSCCSQHVTAREASKLQHRCLCGPVSVPNRLFSFS